MYKANFGMIKLLQVSDSMFPIGQFTLSNGLETFVLESKLQDEADLDQYLSCYLYSLCYNDLLAMMLAYSEDICELDALFYATKAPIEVKEGSRKLCTRFLKLWPLISDFASGQNYMNLIEEGKCKGMFPIAFGLYAKAIGINRREAGEVFCYSQLSAQVTNAVKTVPLSQNVGQSALARVLPRIPDTVEKTEKLKLADLGAGGIMFDIEAMRHEQLYSRQYMS